MPLGEKELFERDAKRNIGEELLQAVRDIKSGKVGCVSTVEVSPIATARLKSVSPRASLLTCSEFHSVPSKSGSKDVVNRRARRSPSSPLPSRNRKF
jgi:hypothetical protein